MNYYTREISMPENKAEGLQNFVQIIINQIERGEHREALLSAVGLLDDLSCGIYSEVTTPEGDGYVPMKEHLHAVAKAKAEGINAGMEMGAKSVRAEVKRLIGDAA